MNQLIRRLLLTWIVLTLMLLVIWVKAHAQSPYLESHHKIVNQRLAPPSSVIVPFVARTSDGIVIVAYRHFKIEMVSFLPEKRLGWTDESKRSISILAGRPLEDEQVTVRHELMHCAIGTVRSDEDASLHEAIYLFSNMEPELVKRNPQLVRYLTQ